MPKYVSDKSWSQCILGEKCEWEGKVCICERHQRWYQDFNTCERRWWFREQQMWWPVQVIIFLKCMCHNNLLLWVGEGVVIIVLCLGSDCTPAHSFDILWPPKTYFYELKMYYCCQSVGQLSTKILFMK